MAEFPDQEQEPNWENDPQEHHREQYSKLVHCILLVSDPASQLRETVSEF